MKRFKIILTLHNSLHEDAYKETFPILTILNYLKLKTICYFSEKVITVSEELAFEVRKYLGLKSTKCYCIYPGIELHEVVKKSLIVPELKVSSHINKKLDSDYFKIVSVGSLQKRKDYPTLFLAIAKLLHKHSNIYLFILGVGGLQEDLKKLAKKLNLDKHIYFLGGSDNPYYFLKFADVYVQASVSEGFGMSLLEAMSLGKPVVSTDCPHGPRELLDGGKAGLLVPVRDNEELATAIDKLLSNEDLYNYYSSKAIKRAQRFSIQTSVNRYIDMLSIISANH